MPHPGRSDRNTLLHRLFKGGSLKIVAGKAPRNLTAAYRSGAADRRGRRHRDLGRGRPGHAGGKAHPVVCQPQDHLRVDAAGRGHKPHCAAVRAIRSARVGNAVPRVRRASPRSNGPISSGRRITPSLPRGAAQPVARWSRKSIRPRMLRSGRWRALRGPRPGRHMPASKSTRWRASCRTPVGASWPPSSCVPRTTPTPSRFSSTPSWASRGGSKPTKSMKPALAARAESFDLDHIPPEVLAVTVGADCQDDRD